MEPPAWISLLNKDIRKLPAPSKRRRGNAPSTTTDSGSHLSLSQASTSATSVTSPYLTHKGDRPTPELLEPLPLGAFRKKRSSYSAYHEPAQLESSRTQRYWNEYDDPESEDEGYYIYVDPNAPVKFPGQELLEAWVTKTRRLLRMENAGEDGQAPSTTGDGTGYETEEDTLHGFSQGYGTMPPPEAHSWHEGYLGRAFRSKREGRDVRALERERESLLTEIELRHRERERTTFLLYASCLGAAVVVDIILGVLSTTSRKKLRGQADTAVILGTICNMLLLVAAVTAMMTRRERLGWLHQGVVFLVVIAMVVVDALLFWWAAKL